MNDEEIEHQILEVFDIESITFLYNQNLEKLYKAKYISKNKMDKSIHLRCQVLKIQQENKWDIKSIKQSEGWLKILKLGDELKIMK